MPRGVRPVLTLVMLVCAIYVFRKLWLIPEAGDLHPALAIVAGALILLIVAAIVNMAMRRRRNRSDDKSTLRL